MTGGGDVPCSYSVDGQESRVLECPKPSRVLPVVAVVLAALALAVSVFTLVRVGHLVKAHNDLVAQLNRERSEEGAVQEATGVPGGRVIGATVDALAGPKTGPDPRDSRRVSAARAQLAYVSSLLMDVAERVQAEGADAPVDRQPGTGRRPCKAEPATLGELRAQLNAEKEKASAELAAALKAAGE